MGKLFNLKEWLTVADAARHLTIAFGEEVTGADVLRLALDRRLRLSLYFPNTFYARPVSEPLLAEVSKETDKMLLEDIPSQEERVWSKRDDFEMLLSVGLVSPNFSDAYKYESEIRLAGGAWWFVYNPCSEQSLESQFHALMGLDQSPPCPNSGTSLIIKGNHDYYYEVLESDGDSKLRPAPVFPKGTTVVVRTEALREFEAAINDAPAMPSTRLHVSDKLAKMNQAAVKFWGNADRSDRGTHPDNSTVTAWLLQQGFSQTLADKAATIIRPEWAPTGRKPEE